MKHVSRLMPAILLLFTVLLPAGNAAAKTDLLILLNIDKKFEKTVPRASLETYIIKALANNDSFSPFFLGAGNASDVISKIRSGDYDAAATNINRLLPGRKVNIWLMISIIPHFEDQDQCYLSYVYHDYAKAEKYYNFIETPIPAEEEAVGRAVTEYVIRQPENMSSKVDVYKPISVCFLIDNSGSMVKNDNDFNPNDLLFHPEQTARANAIKLVFDKLTANDEFAFVFFSGRVVSFEDRFRKVTTPAKTLWAEKRIIDKIAMEPSTDIGEALHKAKDIVRKASYTNVYVIFLSDGSPTEGEQDFRKLREFSRQNISVPVFVIGLEGAVEKPGYRLEKAFLKDLAYDSGGTFNIIKIKDRLESRYGEINHAVDSIFNIIRKEQTILYEEPAKTETVGDRVVYSWDFNINSDCSEFSVLIEPWEENYTVEVINPQGQSLEGSSFKVVKLVQSANCTITQPNCKGQWKLNVKVPQK